MTVLMAALVALAVLLALADGGDRGTRLLPSPDVGETRAVEVADVADLLALVLGSGGAVTPSMSVVAQATGGRLGRDLAMVVAARGWGLGDARSWDLVDEAWQPIARALVLAEAAGVPPSGTLVAAAEDIRRAENHRIDVDTERLGVRLVLPLGLTFLPAFVATTVVPVVAALAGDVLRG